MRISFISDLLSTIVDIAMISNTDQKLWFKYKGKIRAFWDIPGLKRVWLQLSLKEALRPSNKHDRGRTLTQEQCHANNSGNLRLGVNKLQMISTGEGRGAEERTATLMFWFSLAGRNTCGGTPGDWAFAACPGRGEPAAHPFSMGLPGRVRLTQCGRWDLV